MKIAAGTCMWYIYAYHYSDRSTADIFKYFDDSKVLFDALFTSPPDFFKMLFGISNNTSHFAQYYDQMNNWYNKYNSNLYNDSHSIIRINAFMRLFSIGCYHVHTVFISFMTLCGLAGTYHFFNDGLKDKPRVLAIILFLITSVLFWTSGVVKEAV
ncbi:MAG: hypothetical protein IT235_01270, partial [Bacteroidia bacterium]|nr:hypothetical protein [Bacteroidia bacterium]